MTFPGCMLRTRLDLREAYEPSQGQKSRWWRVINVPAFLAIAAGIAFGAATARKFPSSISSFLISSTVYMLLAKTMSRPKAAEFKA